jgi:hypothetical protein
MGHPRLLRVLLVASICAAVVVGPCHAKALDSLPKDGDVIILSGMITLHLLLCRFVT